MKTTVENLDSNTVKVKIEVPALEFEKSLGQAYKKVAGRLNIPGFRPGKAPRPVVDNFAGRDTVLQEAAEMLVPKVYPQAVRQAGIEPVARPTIDLEQMGEGKDLIFSATVQVRPAIDLGDISEVEIEQLPDEPSDAQIDARLNEMREHSVRLEVADRDRIENGDFVHMDFEGFIDGKPFEGGSATDYVLEIGSKQFISGFEEQMIGLEKGKEHQIEVKFPDDYQASELAGRDAVFKVTVKEIKRRRLPELNDEFAKSVSEFDTLKELRDSVAKDLSERMRKQNQLVIRNMTVDRVVEQAKLDVPPALVERHAEGIAEEFSEFLQAQSVTLGEYLSSLDDKGKELREKMMADAEHRARTNLVLSEVVRQEKVEVTDEEIDKEIENLAGRQGQALEDVLAQFDERNRDYLRENLAINKAVDLLVSRVKMTKKKKTQKGAKPKKEKTTSGTESSKKG